MPPKIESYESRSSARGALLGANARGQRYISAIGEAAPALARGFGDVAQVGVDQAEADARAWVQSATSKAQLDAMKTLDEAQRAAPEGADKFTEGLLKSWEKYTGDTIKNAPNERAKTLLSAHLSDITENLAAKASGFESQERDRWRAQQLDDSIDADAQYISTLSMDEIDGAVEKVVGRQAAYYKTLPLEPKMRAAALKAMRDKVTEAANLRKIQLDPSGYLAQNAMARNPDALKNDPNVARGIRNNNPGNLRSSGDAWKGKAGQDEGGYLQFESPEAGIRAMAVNLVNQQKKHGLRTVESIITKYAPASDNNNTGAYIQAVSTALGVKPDQQIDLKDPATLEKFMRAVIKHENGSQPYAPEQIQHGVEAALEGKALPEPAKSATQTRTGSSSFNLGTWEQQQKWVSLAETEQKRLESERRQRVSEGKEVLATVKDRLSQGLQLPEEEMAVVDTLVSQLQDPKLSATWNTMQETQRLTAAMRNLAPAELEQLINTQLQPAAMKDGATEREAMQLEIGQKMLTNMRTEIARDPLSWATKTGADVQPVDFNNVSTIARRASTARAVAERYGLEPSAAIFTASEKEQLKTAMDNMDDTSKLRLARNMRLGYGDSFYSALSSLSEKDKAFTQAAWLATEVPQSEGLALDIFRGQRILKEQPELKPTEKEKQETLAGVVGDAFINMPKALPGIVEAADALYVARVGVAKEFDTRAYQQAVQDVVGARDGKGGIGNLNGSSYLLPAGVSEDIFERFLQAAKPEDVATMAVGGGAPQTARGKPITMPELYREFTFRNIGYNVFAVYDDEGRPVANPKGPQGVFVLQLDSAKVLEIGSAAAARADQEMQEMMMRGGGM